MSKYFANGSLQVSKYIHFITRDYILVLRNHFHFELGSSIFKNIFLIDNLLPTMSRHALSCLQNRRNFLRLIGERRQAFGEPEAQVTREGGAQEK